MSDLSGAPEASEEETPSNDQLQEPSTEKDPEEEPKAPPRSEPQPSHEAVGIGVTGRPQAEPGQDVQDEDGS
ncbi:hypothetical protein [Microbacterium tumbae]